VTVGLGDLRQLLEDGVMAEALELGDESFRDAFGVAFARRDRDGRDPHQRLLPRRTKLRRSRPASASWHSHSASLTSVLRPGTYAGKTRRGNWADLLTQMDDFTGLILAELDRHGIAQDTVVVWSSDNGADASYRFPNSASSPNTSPRSSKRTTRRQHPTTGSRGQRHRPRRAVRRTANASDGSDRDTDAAQTDLARGRSGTQGQQELEAVWVSVSLCIGLPVGVGGNDWRLVDLTGDLIDRRLGLEE